MLQCSVNPQPPQHPISPCRANDMLPRLVLTVSLGLDWYPSKIKLTNACSSASPGSEIKLLANLSTSGKMSS